MENPRKRSPGIRDFESYDPHRRSAKPASSVTVESLDDIHEYANVEHRTRAADSLDDSRIVDFQKKKVDDEVKTSRIRTLTEGN